MTNVKRWITMGLVGSLLGLTACGGSDEPPPEDEAETAGAEQPPPEPPPEEPEPEPAARVAPSPVRVIHAAGLQNEASLAGGTTDAEEPQYPELAYRVPSAYVEIQPAAGETSATFGFGVPDGATVEHTAELEAGSPATIVLMTDAEDAEQLAALTLPDEPHTVTGQARGRFVNAMVGAESLDLCIPGTSRRANGRPVFMNVAYGDFGGIPSFPSRYQPLTLAGVERVQIRESSEETPCSGRIVGHAALPEIDLNVAHNLTVVAIGNRARRPRVAKQLLLCEDAPGNGACTAIPIGR